RWPAGVDPGQQWWITGVVRPKCITAARAPAGPGALGLRLDPPILAANPARGSPPSADRRLPKGPPCECAADRPWTAPANGIHPRSSVEPGSIARAEQQAPDEVHRDGRRAVADVEAPAGQDDVTRQASPVGVADAEPDGAHRLVIGPPVGPGDPGDADADRRAEALARAHGQRL